MCTLSYPIPIPYNTIYYTVLSYCAVKYHSTMLGHVQTNMVHHVTFIRVYIQVPKATIGLPKADIVFGCGRVFIQADALIQHLISGVIY